MIMYSKFYFVIHPARLNCRPTKNFGLKGIFQTLSRRLNIIARFFWLNKLTVQVTLKLLHVTCGPV